MFFYLSKTLGFFAVPSNIVFLILAAGVALLFTRFVRCGRRMSVIGALLLVVVGFSPLGNVLILPLEQRFPRWTGAGTPDGIVVLGGAIGPQMSTAYDEAQLNEAAERVTVVAELARRFPQARIVFSGGNASLVEGGPSEAAYVLPLWESFGIPRSRIELEDRSRNTCENAAFSKALAQPKPGQRWLLVTSASHMPRAVGCFRRVGFPVAAYPVDWRAGGAIDLFIPFGTVTGGLARTDVAVREWIGLVVYWLSGRTSELFPGPG